MANQGLALPWLYETVSASLAADLTPVANAFGWRIPGQHPYSNRIAWVPGDPNGAIGTMGPPRNPGGDPRSLGTLNELFHVVISGQDPTDPENELLQYSIVRYLRDAWYRAVYHAVHGAFGIKYEQWNTDRLERRFGAALVVVCELQTTIPDEPYPDNGQSVVDPPLEADLTVSELDVDETIHVSGDDPL